MSRENEYDWGGITLKVNNLEVNAAAPGAVGTALSTDGDTVFTATSDSTHASNSVEPVVMNSTMTGVGGVGGRAKFRLDTNVALGGWANALKAHTVFGATGKVTGLGSALVAEMELSAGTTTGSYAPLEVELGMSETAESGDRVSFMSLNAYGHATGLGKLDDNGSLFDLNGLTAGDAHIFRTGLSQAVTASANLRIKVGGTNYFIPLCVASALTS
jgi:hypothetical protein